MAVGYASGLVSAWGVIMNMNLLIWRRVQWDAKRVMRRKKSVKTPKVGQNGDATAVDGIGHHHQEPNGQGLTQRKNISNGNGHSTLESTKTTSNDDTGTEGNYTEDGYELYWQPFPAEAPFLDRLWWVADLAISFRGAGWNFAISSIPRPSPPSSDPNDDTVDTSTMETCSSAGYYIPTSKSDFFKSRLINIATLYLTLDFLSVFMMKDPYFVVGPDQPQPGLPFYLRNVSPWLLLVYRELFSITGVLCAIAYIFNATEVASFLLGEVLWPNRNMNWLYASTFGSLSAIWYDGLAGWWGSWWHQSFRLQLLGPAHYCLREGYIQRHSTFGDGFALFVSFFLSGFLHMPGSMTAVPETKPWRSMAFFVFQAVGITIQKEVLKPLLRKRLGSTKGYLFKMVNVLFALAWMYPTAKLFCDDIASTGIWMFEPIPISPLRWLGYGRPGDSWWRWPEDYVPSFYVGKYWWQSGISI